MTPPLTDDMVHWITERYNIHIAKDVEKRPAPWSQDPIFQQVRFCNVHREDDKVTQWIRQNWNRPYDPVWRFVVARMINYIPSLDDMAECRSMDEMKDALRARQHGEWKVFTSAYTISTCGKSMDKLDYVFDWVLARVLKHQDQVRYESLHNTWKDLCVVDGLGSFLAAQVVADMKNTPGHPLEDAPDWWSWSAPGPGSLRGLSWFFLGKPEGITPSVYQGKIMEAHQLVTPKLPNHIPRIHMQDFQNVCCEFSKYIKVRELNGHVRNRYQGA